jgi:hypothetical protein
MSYEALSEDKPRRVRLLELHPDLVLDLLKVNEDSRVTIQGRTLECVGDAIPAGATVASCGLSDRGNIMLHVSHESFSPIAFGGFVPRIAPAYKLADAPPASDSDAVQAAAWEADWGQVVRNGGPPCFHVCEDGRFCFRAPQWGGHDGGVDHDFVSLADLLSRVSLPRDILGSITDSFAKPRWISVEDRLPASGEVVLVWKPDARVALGYVRNGQWVNTLYGWVIQPGPTHWMPLPADPGATT